MSVRPAVMLLLALAFGAVAVVLAQRLVADRASVAEVDDVKVSPVVVARVPLGFGNRISPENVRVVEWPTESVPQGTFASIDALLGTGAQRTERVVLRSIEAGEPILSSKISGSGGRASLSAIIEENMRAMTIRVNDVNGVAGFVLPGDRVDVLLTRKERDKSPVTAILLQNVKVLGVDQIANENKDKPVVARTVTVEVTPEQAQKLTLASSVGSLSLALRNQVNVAAAKVGVVTLSDLRVGEANDTAEVEKDDSKRVKVVTPPRDPGARVRVYRGTNTASYHVNEEKAAPVGDGARITTID